MKRPLLSLPIIAPLLFLTMWERGHSGETQPPSSQSSLVALRPAPSANAGQASWAILPPPPVKLPQGKVRSAELVTDPSKSLGELKTMLASSGESDPVRQGALDWGIQESERLLAEAAAGDARASERAKALMGDLLSAAKDPSYPSKQPESPRYFPQIRDFPNNPGARGIFDISPYLKTSPDNIRKQGRNGELGDRDDLSLAYTTLHPQSPERGNKEGIRALLTALDNSYQDDREKLSWSEHEAAIAYLLLKSVYPDLVPPSVQASWEVMIRKRADKVMSECSVVTANDYHGRSWLNGDMRNIIMTGFAGIILGERKYSDFMATAMDRICELLQPDGATNYTAFQNEAWIYHDAAIRCAAWYWLITENKAALGFVAESAPFYPIAVHRGLGEEYTAPEQKHYYNGIMHHVSYPALIAGDPDAVAAGDIAPDHLNAFFYDPAMAKGSVPDNFTLFDRNIIGPRGRYGDLDFAISTRDFNYYPGKRVRGGRFPDKGFGFTTLFGMRILNTPEESSHTWPLNVVAERLMNRVEMGGKEFNKGQELDSSVSMAGKASALGARFLTSSRNAQNVNWDTLPFRNDQEWIVTPERAVGLLRIDAMESVPGASISTALEFVSGRGKWGVRKELVKTGESSYIYGKLNIRIIGTSHVSEEITYTNGGLEKDTMRGVLRLKGDKAKQVNNGSSRGDSSWCLVELYPDWSSPAREIRRIDAGSGLTGIEVTDSGKTLVLIHNPGDNAVNARFVMPAGYSRYSLHLGTDGSVDRDKYFNRISFKEISGRESGNKAMPLASSAVNFTLPQHRILLAVGTNDAADHADGFKFYGDVFNNTTALP